MCLSEWGGRLVVGGYNQSYHTGTLHWLPMTASSYYAVALQTIEVNGVQIYGASYGDTIVDSGI